MRTLAISIAVALCAITNGAAQSEKLQGVTYKSPGGTTLRLMLDESNVGPSVSVGEMIFPPNTDSGDHQHWRARDVLRRLGRASSTSSTGRARSSSRECAAT